MCEASNLWTHPNITDFFRLSVVVDGDGVELVKLGEWRGAGEGGVGWGLGGKRT